MCEVLRIAVGSEEMLMRMRAFAATTTTRPSATVSSTEGAGPLSLRRQLHAGELAEAEATGYGSYQGPSLHSLQSFSLQVRKRKLHLIHVSDQAGAELSSDACVPWGSCHTDILGEGSRFSTLGDLPCQKVIRNCRPL